MINVLESLQIVIQFVNLGIENYAEQISQILYKYNLMDNLIISSKQWIQKFSDESFMLNLKNTLDKFINNS